VRQRVRAARAVLALALAGVLGCAQGRVVRPLAVGEQVLGGSLGGPVVALFGAAFPAPILQVSAARGLRERLAVAGNLDLTAALYGTLHLEPALVWHPLVRDRGPVPSLGLAGSLHVLTDFGDLLLAPQLSGVASWVAGQRHVLYAGVDTAFVRRTTTRLVVGPLLGAQTRRGRLDLTVELKWLAPNYDVAPLAPSWLSPGHHGFLSVLLGLGYHRSGP
jgi:hypothetical protein